MNDAQARAPLQSPLGCTDRIGRKPGSGGNLTRCGLLGLGLGLLLSCAGTPPAPVVVSAPRHNPEQSFATGDYAQAARLWQQQALSAEGTEASVLRINAADAWLLANQPGKAQGNLRWVDRSELPAPELARMNLVLADLALRTERPDEAEILLQQAAPELPQSSRARYQDLLAKTDQALSRPGARDLSKAILLSRESTHYRPEQALALLESLESVSSSELALRANNSRADPLLTGWLDLALVIRQNLVRPEKLPHEMALWKGRHPQHILTQNDALDLWLRYRQQFKAPLNVAVLLPETGRLKAAANAIRDGIMSAFLDHPGGAELHFLSTGSEGELTASAYFEARDIGAQWIVGPLQTASIKALLNLAGLVTPLLALNDLPQDFHAPPGLTGQIDSISLSQDDEVHALAREVSRAGLHRAIIFAPDTEWGERTAWSFREDFLQQNGEIMASSRYLESENDHSAALERLLKIDESKAREKDLERTLQMKLEFEPVRRNDVDVIFLAAGPTQGRQICPQFRFHYAGDIPVYATSRIYSGQPDPIRDQDLNGLRFPITPLQLESGSGDSMPRLSSLRDGAFAALYALGKDAWNLLPWLELMQRNSDFRFPGDSGTYRAGPAGKLLRAPAFAVFSAGLPVPLTDRDGPVAGH